MTIVAQISDLHVKPAGRLAYGVVDTLPFLERAVAKLLALDPLPDAVVASGDLVDGGRADEYARLRAALAVLPMPVYLVPGNHDDVGALRAAFPERGELHGAPGHCSYAVDAGDLRIVALDSTLPGREGGYVDAARSAWLDDTLAAALTPVLLVLHHPPFATGLRRMDEKGFVGLDGLTAVVRRHPHVLRVACGHLHRPIVTGWAGTVVTTVPSTAHQLALDLRDDVRLGFTLEPPSFALHVYDGGALVTHYAAVEVAPGPYPFHEPDGGFIGID